MMKSITEKTGRNGIGEVTSFLNIKIETCNSIELVQILLSKDIPFSISSENFDKQISNKLYTKKDKNIKEYEKATSEKNEAEWKPLIQQIYQKYIVDGVEMMPPKINDIAKEINISPPLFKNYFVTLYGDTFYQVYINHKMEYASQLLKQGISASSVSARIGYSHPIKFNKMFQKYFGISPKKYQLTNNIYKNERAEQRYRKVNAN